LNPTTRAQRIVLPGEAAMIGHLIAVLVAGRVGVVCTFFASPRLFRTTGLGEGASETAVSQCYRIEALTERNGELEISER